LTSGDLTYATLRMGMRPPRVAIIFDGEHNWQYWARLALYACTRVWGGRGFILVPHRRGEVDPEVLRAVRAYDPDYVVRLQRTLGAFEETRPGVAQIKGSDGSVLEGNERAEYIREHSARPLPSPEEEEARQRVVEACAPHRRRMPAQSADSGREWDERVRLCSVEGRIGNLTKAADAGTAFWNEFAGGSAFPGPTCLASPPEWGGALGLAVAAQCGVVEMPRTGTDPDLSREDFNSLLSWLIELGLPMSQPSISEGKPIRQIIWQTGPKLGQDPATLPDAFRFTMQGLVPVARGVDYPARALLSIGDAAEDFALAHIYQRLYGAAFWLPVAWAAALGSEAVSFLLSTPLFRFAMDGIETTVASTSLPDDEIDGLIGTLGLHEPLWYSEGERDDEVDQLRKQIKRGRAVWSTKRVQYLAVSADFDRDFAVPIERAESGDAEMLIPCPAPTITESSLTTAAARAAGSDQAGASGLRWQVDIELTPSDTPHGRGLDGHELFAEGDDRYLTSVRSGRDRVTFESERFNFIVAGTPAAARLARPRLRAPSLATWANLMASQQGRSMVLSPAGQRVEVVRRLWGDRALLAADFTGPMFPVLRRFCPGKTPESLELDAGIGVALPSGSGDVLHEPYLTFEGITKAAGEGTAAAAIRQRTDEFLRRGVLRRGLVLRCELCSKLAFYTIDDLQQVNRCPRCSTPNDLVQPRWKNPANEPTWFYDLHPSVRDLIAENGDVPLLLSHHLRTNSRVYADVGELELRDATGSAVAEADLIAHADGLLITAEAKRPADLGSGRVMARALAKRALLAEQLQADQILLATAAPAWPEGAIAALSKEISTRPWRRVVPRARLVSGLGTGTVVDLAVDTATASTSPWRS